MIKTTQETIRKAGKKLGLDDFQIDKLLAVNKTHEFEITLGDETYKAFRAQHSNKLGPYKGGVRFHPGVNKDDVEALATLMSLKTAAMGLPLGGGKAGIVVDPTSLSEEQLEELSRKFVQEIHQHIGPDKDIPAPDVNTNAKIIDWMVNEYEQITGDNNKASFTGKSIKNGGSQGREAATGRGGVFALHEYLLQTNQADKELTIALQGFGNVGSHFVSAAIELFPNWKIIAVGDSSATAINENGLATDKLFAHKKAKNPLKEGTFASLHPVETIISQKVDVLVLAALGNAVTEKNVDQIQADLLVELANGPIDEAAEQYLLKQNKVILPDIIANAGGVVVSYLEWQQNLQNQKWDEEFIFKQMEEYMRRAIKNIFQLAQKEETSLKEAATMLAIKKLAK